MSGEDAPNKLRERLTRSVGPPGRARSSGAGSGASSPGSPFGPQALQARHDAEGAAAQAASDAAFLAGDYMLITY